MRNRAFLVTSFLAVFFGVLTSHSLAATLVADWPISTIGASDQGQITDPVGGNDSISFGNWRNLVGPVDPTLGVPMDGIALIMNQGTSADFGQGKDYAITNTIGYGSFTLFYRFAMTTGGWFDITKGEAIKIRVTGNWDNYSWVEVLVNGSNIAHGPAFTTEWSLPAGKQAWHDVVVVCDMGMPGSSYLTLYFDGIQVDTWNPPIVNMYNNDPFVVKRQDTGGTQNGYLEAMRLYSGPLTAGEVKALSVPMTVTPESAKVGNQSGQMTFNVAKINSNATLNWTATVVEGDGWLTITGGGSGTDNGTISVSYTANEDLTNARTGKIRVTTSAGFTQDITVTQGSSMVGDWKINEGSGTTLADSSGNGNTANAYWAINGWDTTGSNVPANLELGVPSDGKSISLQAQEYITLSTGSNTQVNNVFGGAFSLFYRFSNQTGASFSVSKGGLSINTHAEWNDSNWIDVSVNGVSVANGVEAFVSNTPKDIAVTWDPVALRLNLYVDGQYKQGWSAPAGTSFQNTGDLGIVRENRAGSNKAWIESARLYNVALTSNQIRALSNSMFVTPESGKVGNPAGQLTFDVIKADSNTTANWTATVVEGAGWLSITNGNSGTNNGTISVSYTANEDPVNTRTGKIRVIADSGFTKDIPINQGSSLVANWKMDEGSGTTLADSSGNGNTANAYWAVNGWNSTAIPMNAGIGAPSDGKSISLQAQEYITLGAGNNTMVNDTFAGSFTVFFRFANQPGGWFDVIKGNLSISNNGNWTGYNWIGVTVNGNNIANGVDAFADGTPMDIALTWNSTTRYMGLYLNGVFKQAWTEAAPDLSFANTSPFLIQRWDTAGSNVAWIESARLYNVALTAGQIRALSVAMTLEVTPESQSVSSEAGVVAFDVVNADGGAMSWTAQVVSGGDWLTITSGASGTGDGMIMAGFGQNTSTTADRTATIRITAPGAANSPRDVTLIQAKVEQPTRIPGDASGDGKVDVSDLGILAANYGTTSGATWAMGDFTGDGKVDVSDLGILAANYGRGSGGATQASDLQPDMKALGFLIGPDELATVQEPAQKTENPTQDSPVAQSLGGCGSAGLPLVAGLALMGLLLVKLEE